MNNPVGDGVGEGNIGTPVVDPAINDTTPNSSTTPWLNRQIIYLNIGIK
jgi:hypothetical protein